MEISALANPGRACGGIETACCTITRKQNKRERINQIGKGGPSVDTGGFLNCVPEKFFLCLENCLTWGKAVCKNLTVTFIQFLLSPLFCPVFPICNLYFRRLLITICTWMLPLSLCPFMCVQTRAWWPGKFLRVYSKPICCACSPVSPFSVTSFGSKLMM